MGDEPEKDKEVAAGEYEELLRIAGKYKKFRENSNSKKLGNYVSNKPGDSFKGN